MNFTGNSSRSNASRRWGKESVSISNSSVSSLNRASAPRLASDMMCDECLAIDLQFTARRRYRSSGAHAALERRGLFDDLLPRRVQGDGLADQRLQGGRVDLLSFADVDGSPHVSIEARVEQLRWIRQRG